MGPPFLKYFLVIMKIFIKQTAKTWYHSIVWVQWKTWYHSIVWVPWKTWYHSVVWVPCLLLCWIWSKLFRITIVLFNGHHNSNRFQHQIWKKNCNNIFILFKSLKLATKKCNRNGKKSFSWVTRPVFKTWLIQHS